MGERRQDGDAAAAAPWRVRAIIWRDIVLATCLPGRQARRRQPKESPMAAKLRHLAINADDVQRAKAFYEAVFGWRFEPWGPPEYYQAHEAGEGFLAALQHRRELKPGARMLGFEATMAVEDIAVTVAAIEAAGGRIVTRPIYIDGVGKLVYFEDPEGNLVGVMQYDRDAL
jgi:uncharacterized protein